VGTAGTARRDTSLDVLRTIAALGVVATHARWLAHTASGRTAGFWNAVHTSFWDGTRMTVYIFFALSGFLIARPFVTALLDGRPLPAWRDYARRRVARIVPAYWLAFTGFLVFGFAVGATPLNVIDHYLLVHNEVPGDAGNLLPVAWTLGIEASFYVAVPLVAIAVRRRWTTAVSEGRMLAWVVVLAAASAALNLAVFTRLLPTGWGAVEQYTLPAQFQAGCDDPIPASQPSNAFKGISMIGNYAGPLTLDEAGTSAYTGSRDSNILNGVSLASDGNLYCRGGVPGDVDCRKGVVDLGTAANPDGTALHLEGPYAIVPGLGRLPGSDSDAHVLYVAALIPHVDQTLSNTLYTSATIAALDMSNPSRVVFSMLASSQLTAGGIGVGPMVFDPVRRQLLMSGCFQRFGGGVGSPGSGRCSSFGSNILRVLDVDSGPAAQVRIYDMSINPSTGTTSGLLLSGGDPATGRTPDTLWASVHNPDALVEMDLPSVPSTLPSLRHVTSLPISPADLVRIPRPGASDLIAVAASGLGALVLYDAGARQVVAQLERLGDVPFTVKLLPSPAGVARLAVSVFGDCRVAFVEVPLDRPWDVALRGRAGSCP
jgi:hypothetical protein